MRRRHAALRCALGRGAFSARLDSRSRPDVVLAYNGEPVRCGGGVSFLIGEHVGDIGLQAAFYDCAFSVEEAQESAEK
ncbi:MAG: hypothetical protein WAO51_02715 [Bacillota bacterium]